MGFFSKKAAPAPAAPRAKAPPQPAPIAITGLGIACHAGDQPYELISSVLGQVSGVKLSRSHKVKSKRNNTYAMVRMAPVEEVADIRAQVRMNQLTTTALSNAEAELLANVTPEKLLIVVMVDPDLITHKNEINPQLLQRHIVDEIPQLATAIFRIQLNNAGSSSNALRAAVAELNEGTWHAVIFGGADSLISMEACQKLHQADRLYVAGKRAGIAPGEGAAFVVLQTNDSAKTNTTPALAYLRGLGVAPEPNARDSDLEATEGLTSAINQAIAQAGIAATDIQGIVHNLGAETVQSLEWYQTTQQIWPRRISEQQRMAVQLGEIERADLPDDPIPQTILPYMTMGYLGAAALPMQLAMALAWIEYDARQARWGFPIRSHLLVCDTPDAPERGASVVSTTPA
jgi:hypothetical protein